MRNNWIEDQVDVSKLNLDLDNPRIPKHVKDHNDTNVIRNYLLEKEEVLKIARSIAKNGYHQSAVAITYLESGKMIVLDGNRRLAACQLLLDPKLAPKARDKKELENLNKDFDVKDFENIKIVTAPSRKEAEKEIWNIHVTPLLRPWQTLQKLRMYRNLIDSGEYDISKASEEYGIAESTFKRELTKLYFHEQILGGLSLEKEEDELINSGFNKIERMISSTNGKKLLNYSIDDMGKIIIQDQKIFDENLEKLVPYIVTPGLIHAQAKQEDLIVEVYSKIDPILFPLKKKDLKSNKKKKKVSRGTSAKDSWVTDAEYKSYKGSERVKDILKEMSKNRPDKNNINILAITLRIVIELAIYDKLDSKGYIKQIIAAHNKKRNLEGKHIVKNWTPGLKEMLLFVLKKVKDSNISPQDKKVIDKLLRDRKDFIEDLNFYIHISSYSPTKTKINETWKTFCRPIFDIISKMN